MDLEKRTEIPNSLEEHWMPFTSNRDYKNSPRLMVKAEGVYYTDHYGNKLAFNLLSLEPEFDGNFIDLEYCQLFYNYLSIMGYEIGKEAAFDALLTAARNNQYKRHQNGV